LIRPECYEKFPLPACQKSIDGTGLLHEGGALASVLGFLFLLIVWIGHHKQPN
jgi:hypothetical protein